MSDVEAPDKYRAILSGEARSVDVAAIEHELTQLWKAAAEDTLDSHPVVRASVLNLVAYAPDDDVARHVNEVISQVSGRHPNRSIVIVADPDAGAADLRASIAAYCQVPVAGGKQVCSEQVTLRASAAAIDEAHAAIASLLVPDLPVFLWWHDEPPPRSHLFQELMDSSDHLVVDSADFAPERAAGALRRVQRLARRSNIALSDLNWSRLTHWRELIAQFFDAPPGREYLDRLEGVSIQIAAIRGREPDFTEALLLVGWLAARLGWTLDRARRPHAGAVTVALKSASGAVRVELMSGPENSGEGLRSLVLGVGDDASFSISHKAGDEGCVVVAAEMRGVAGYSRVVRLDTPPEAGLLCEELDTLAPDPVFDEALACAVRFMGRGG